MIREKIRKYKVIGGAALSVAVFLFAYSKPVWTHPDYSNTVIPETTEASYYSSEDKARIVEQFAEASKDEVEFAKDTAGKAIDYGVDIADAVADRVSKRHQANQSSNVSDFTDASQSASSSDAISEESNSQTTTLLPCPSGFELAELIRVSDGDTIYVKVIEDNTNMLSSDVGVENYVRLIGMNTPESSAAERVGYHDSTTYGEMASSYTKNLLKEIKYVWLSKDTSDTDKYGRLLRYVWISEPVEGDPEDMESVTKKTLNAILLSSGYADTLFLKDKKYQTLFLSLEQNAKENSTGLWQYTDNFTE